MKKTLNFILISFLLFSGLIQASSVELIPVLHEGRYRPLAIHARFFFRELSDENNPDIQDPLSFFISLYFQGYSRFIEKPLFYVDSQELRKALGSEKKRVSYQTLIKNRSILEATNEGKALLSKMEVFREGAHFFSLPSKFHPSEWIDIKKLLHEKSISFFPEETEKHLKKALENWIKTGTVEGGKEFATIYFDAYQTLAGKAIDLSDHTAITLPTLFQLQVEKWSFEWPLISYSLLLYLASLLCFLIGYYFANQPFLSFSKALFFLAFFFHTLFLISRIYILSRPPVSNMAETLIYVPWVTSLVALILSLKIHEPFLIALSTLQSVILLSLLESTFGSQILDNVQPVLNSQLWLTIHVLMVVGSYALLLLAGVLAHLYLLKNKKSSVLETTILQLMYAGMALLIPGTLLGGVWAAQSWGRFWDWDPKESWAFISICFYLLAIHAYRFRIIHGKGLALSALSGMLAISFTWYGVNYILGTGLHSYGFGSGGESFYYAFVISELLFIGYVLSKRKEQKMILFQREALTKDQNCDK